MKSNQIKSQHEKEYGIKETDLKGDYMKSYWRKKYFIKIKH